MKSKSNCRLVFWHNDGCVKITLKPGQTLTFGQGRSTDEGYKSENHMYYYPLDDDRVYYTYDSYERDCDGPCEYYYEGSCEVNKSFNDEEMDELGNLLRHRPQWIQNFVGQKDTYAEMAGY